jgi:hypothetical protein
VLRDVERKEGVKTSEGEETKDGGSGEEKEGDDHDDAKMDES